MSAFQNSSPEEVFRFSVVRNPVDISSKKFQDTVVEIVREGDGAYEYTKILIDLRQHATRKELIAEAERLINAPEFMDRLYGRPTPIWLYVERLQRLPKLTLSSARDLIEQVFGKKASELWASDAFRGDIDFIADCLVLASVVSPPLSGLRTKLMLARRAGAFIERLASTSDQGEAGSERLLMATLLLPTLVFPIPDENNSGQDKNKKAYNLRKALLEKKNAQAQQLLDKLSRNRAAAEELSTGLTRHLFELNQYSKEDTEQSSLHVLPTEKIKMLSSATRKVLLDDLKISETGIDVPFVISQIERDNVNSGRELTTKYGGLLADADPSCFIGCQNVGECKGPVLPPPDPDNDFTPDARGKVEVVGLQNLLIVRQKLLEYRDGEISHIENVLQSEEKGTTNRRLDRTEVTTVEEVEKEKTVENELQTTDKYELQSQASQVIQEDKHLEAGVTITASYGPVSIETHGNYASNTSNQESKNSSSTFARDVTSRSLQRIRERVLTRRTRTEITESEVTNVHKFVNTSQGAHNISGIYRWVDKFYEAQIVNYGQRLMLEFMIPEPAAFYRYALTKRTPPTNVPRPEAPGFCCDDVFYPLSPDNLQSDNYLCFVSKYNAKNVTGPPPLYLWITDMIKYKIDSTTNEAPFSFAEPSAAEVGTLKVPDGYFPKTVRYHISGSEVHSVLTTGGDHDDNMFVQVTIANHKVWSFYHNEIGNKNGFDTWPDIGQVIEWGSELSDAEKALGSEYTGNIDDEFILPEYYSEPGAGVTESIKISMTGHSTLPISVAIHYKVLCERSQAAFQKWQMDTYNAIMAAYQLLKEDYEDALQNQQNQQIQQYGSFDGTQGSNPLINREIEKRELKKFSISLLTGQQYDSFNAMEYDYQTGIPQIDLADASAEGKFVRFFEQALEWINITYLFYPYFWGRKNHWAETIMVQSTDPLFEQFLKAGYARVWAPVRPGFESVILNYIECGGDPWNERDAPIIDERQKDVSAARPRVRLGVTPSVALMDEIKEQLGVNFEFRPGTIKVRKDNKWIEGSGTDFREDDRDREILIALKYYRIARVNEADQKIKLSEPYAGKDQDDIGFAIGVKFEGEPWVVQVPTTLVHLTRSDDLISE